MCAFNSIKNRIEALHKLLDREDAVLTSRGIKLRHPGGPYRNEAKRACAVARRHRLLVDRYLEGSTSR